MCRCGGNAAVVRSARRVESGPAPQQARASLQDVAMEYLGPTALLLKGPVSRRVYAFSPGRRDVQIDARDAQALSASRLFARTRS